MTARRRTRSGAAFAALALAVLLVAILYSRSPRPEGPSAPAAADAGAAGFAVASRGIAPATADGEEAVAADAEPAWDELSPGTPDETLLWDDGWGEPWPLRGRVVDPDGTPIEGALVRLLGSECRGRDFGVRTGPDGGFLLRARRPLSIPDGFPYCVIAAGKPGWRPAWARSRKPGTEIVLERASPDRVVTGRVVDRERGGPVAGARITFEAWSGVLAETKSDANGRFEIRCDTGFDPVLPETREWVERKWRMWVGEEVALLVEARGYPGQAFRLQDLQGAVELGLRPAPETMDEMGPLRIRVVDDRGTGVAGAIVRLVYENELPRFAREHEDLYLECVHRESPFSQIRWGNWRRWERTDGRGAVVEWPLRPRVLEVRVRDPDLGIAEKVVDGRDGWPAEPVTIELRTPGRLLFDVRGIDASHPHEIRIRSQWNEVHEVELPANGRASVAIRERGEKVIEVYRSSPKGALYWQGQLLWRAPVRIDDPYRDRNVAIEIPARSITVRGTLKTGSGEPLPGYRVVVGSRFSITDSDGRYEIRELDFLPTWAMLMTKGGESEIGHPVLLPVEEIEDGVLEADLTAGR